MGYVKLFLYVIFLIVSIINLIVFYTKKNKAKNTTKKNLSGLQSHRALTYEEAQAINELHKCNITAGIPVYTLSGNYEKTEITVNHSSTEAIHTMNGILIQPCKGLEKLLETANEIEISVLDNKKGAIVVSVNKQSSIVNEFEREKALKNGSSYNSKTPEGNSFSITKGRVLREEEYNYIKNDARVFVNIGIFALFIISFFVTNYYVSVALVAIAIFIFAKFYIPKNIRNFDTSKADCMTILSGKLLIEGNYYVMDRYNLIFPKQSKSRLKNGDTIEIGGKFKRNKTQFKVLTLNNQSIIPEQGKKDRFILTASIAVALIVFILIPFGNILKKIEHTIYYQKTKNLQVVYNNYDELKSASLQKGQYIELKNFLIVPSDIDSYYSNQIIFSNDKTKPDFSALVEYLTKLRQLQETEEFLNLFSFSLESDLDWYYFESTFHQNKNTNSIQEYKEFFSETNLLEIISETSQVLDEITNTDTYETPIRYPSEGNLKKYLEGKFNYSNTLGFFVESIEKIYLEFLNEQADYIQKIHNNIETNTYKTRDQIVFYCDNRDPFMESISYNPYSLTRNSVALFKKSKNYQSPIIKLNTLSAESDLVNYINQLDSRFTITDKPKGIVKDFQVDDKGKLTNVSLNVNKDYSDIPNNLKDILIFTLILVFMLYAVCMWLYPIKKETDI